MTFSRVFSQPADTRSLTQSLSRSRRGRILRQRNVIAECGLQAFDGAILIAAARAAPDADRADHLAVNNDREAS